MIDSPVQSSCPIDVEAKMDVSTKTRLIIFASNNNLLQLKIMKGILKEFKCKI